MDLNWREFTQTQRLQSKSLILALIYLSYITLLTMKPFEFSTAYFVEFIQFRHGFLPGILGSFKTWDFLLNILFFVPFGFFVRLNLSFKKLTPEQMKTITLISCLFITLIAEFSQLFSIRTFSLLDILANMLGGFIGLKWAAKTDFQQSILSHFIVIGRYKPANLVRTCYLFIVFGILAAPLFLNNFSNWDSSHHLFVGNEATGDRQWTGTIHEVAIYKKMLNETEILQCNYERRPLSANTKLIALYLFDEDSGQVVRNHVKHGCVGNLKINNLQKVQWLPQENAIQILPGGWLSTENLSGQIVCALQRTNQLSIEIRFQPENLSQEGPARLITFSADTENRNFMLGQAGQFLNFRVRTPLTGKNGSQVDYLSETPVLTSHIQHVVAIFNRGLEQIYVNGKHHHKEVHSFSNYFPKLAGFGTSEFGKMAFFFLLLFPLGWLYNRSKRQTEATIVVGVIFTLLPVFMVQFLGSYFFKHPLDLPLLNTAIFTTLLTLLTSFFPYARGRE